MLQEHEKQISNLMEENLHWRGQYHLLSRKINVIPVKKVKDKIEEYDKKMTEDAGHPNWVVSDRIVMNVLKELLED